MPLLDVEGRRIHYAESRGEEPALVLVHSSGLDHRQWGALRLALRGDRRILAPDLLGYGKSGAWVPGTPFTMDDDVAVVSAVLEQTGSPAVLVGHSYGGYLALRAALRAPERVRGLVVHEPVIWGVLYGVGDPETIAEIERANADGLFLDGKLGGQERWWRRFVEIWGGEGAWDALPPERRAAFLAVGPKVFEEVRALFLDRTPAATWAELRMPVVITVGEGTQPLEIEACEVAASAIPDASLVEIGGGHMGPLRAPAAFAEVVEGLVVRLSEG